MPIVLNDIQPYVTYPFVNNGVPVFIGPNFSPLSIQTTDVGSKDVGALFAVNQGTMTFTNIGALPSGVTFNNGVYSWAGLQVQGTSSMITRATGSLAPTQPTDFSWTLQINAPSGGAPVFTGPILNQSYTDNTGIYTFDISTYATGQTSYSVVGLPVTGITFNTSTGVFTIDTGAAAIGTYNFTVTYINGFGSTQSNPSFSLIVAQPKSNRIFIPGIYVALSYSQQGLGPAAGSGALSADLGPTGKEITFSYGAGSAATGSMTITGRYSDGTVAGGSNGAGTSQSTNDGSGVGGHGCSRNVTGPCVDFENIGTPKIPGARTQAVVMRFPWNDLEPTKDHYDFKRMDACLAQCIALDVLFFPIIVQKTFGNSEANGGSFTDGVGAKGDGDCMPPYLANFRSAGQGGTGCTCWRWDETNIKPRMVALITAMGNRYDLCSHFGGICTQETATAGADSAATNSVTQGTSPNGGDTVASYPISHYNCLIAEVDACFTANPHGRQLIFQNYGASTVAAGDRMMEDYAAYAVTKGAILAGPDLTLGGSVYDRCYTSPAHSGLKGRYYAYHNGGNIKLGSGCQFPAASGPTGCSIQRAEWTGIVPSYKGASPPTLTWTVQNTFDYGVNSYNGKAGTKGQSTVSQKLNSGLGSPISAVNPDYLELDIVIIDWHQDVAGAQQFSQDGVNLIKNNPSPFGSWKP